MKIWEQLKKILVVVNDDIYDAVLYSHSEFGKVISIFFKDIETMRNIVKTSGKVQFEIKEKIAGTSIFNTREMIGELISYTDESQLITPYKVSFTL